MRIFFATNRQVRVWIDARQPHDIVVCLPKCEGENPLNTWLTYEHPDNPTSVVLTPESETFEDKRYHLRPKRGQKVVEGDDNTWRFLARFRVPWESCWQVTPIVLRQECLGGRYRVRIKGEYLSTEVEADAAYKDGLNDEARPTSWAHVLRDEP